MLGGTDKERDRIRIKKSDNIRNSLVLIPFNIKKLFVSGTKEYKPGPHEFLVKRNSQ